MCHVSVLRTILVSDRGNPTEEEQTASLLTSILSP